MAKQTKQNFKSFYDVLEETLKEKRVRLRSYDDKGGLPDGYHCYKHKKDEVVGWNDKSKFLEWTGTVKSILQNDNSHVDIIFDKTKPRTNPGKGYYEDCFNWHMGDYIEILDDKLFKLE